jgi:hypothetical protein
MTQYAFAIVVENEVAEILYADESREDYINILRSSPVIIDVTNLGYYPDNDSVWDGSNFKIPGTSENSIRPTPDSYETGGKVIIAWTVDNVCKMRTIFPVSLKSEAYYSALLSNPIFIELQESEIEVVLPGWTHNGISFVSPQLPDFNPDVPPPAV